MAVLSELLAEADVTFCVDTNILIEVKPPGDLPWREHPPSAYSVRIIVPAMMR
jgi:hypothetical protein